MPQHIVYHNSLTKWKKIYIYICEKGNTFLSPKIYIVTVTCWFKNKQNILSPKIQLWISTVRLVTHFPSYNFDEYNLFSRYMVSYTTWCTETRLVLLRFLGFFFYYRRSAKAQSVQYRQGLYWAHTQNYGCRWISRPSLKWTAADILNSLPTSVVCW